MKHSSSYFLLFLLLLGCTQFEEQPPLYGEVKFNLSTSNTFSGKMPQGRTSAESNWRHIFGIDGLLKIRDTNTGQVYYFEYDTRNFHEGFQVSLPFGTYSYSSKITGGDYEFYLPFKIEGTFQLSASAMDVTLDLNTEYGLITVKNEYVQKAAMRIGADLVDLRLLEDGSHYYVYARQGTKVNLEIVDIFESRLFERELEIKSYTHYHYYLDVRQSIGNANFIELALGEFELIEEGLTAGLQTGTFTDKRDGQNYKTIQIGDQVWMAENLNYAIEESWCFDNDDDNCRVYGRYYEAKSALEVCPEGWHLPSKEDWDRLSNYLGGSDVAGGKMKTTVGWLQPNLGATNESGFSGLPSGYGDRAIYTDVLESRFYRVGLFGNWWSSHEYWDEELGPLMDYYEVKYSSESLGWLFARPGDLYPCRCVKD